jgi:hypothetical protein
VVFDFGLMEEVHALKLEQVIAVNIFLKQREFYSPCVIRG